MRLHRAWLGQQRRRSPGSTTPRHTCASYLRAQCLPVAAVSAWLGHSSPAFTMRQYIYASADGLDPALPVLPADPARLLMPHPFYKLQFRPALIRAGLPPSVRIHDLRQTYASPSAAAGIPPYRVSRRLGHSGVDIKDPLYTHLFATDDAGDMELMGRPRTALSTLYAF